MVRPVSRTATVITEQDLKGLPPRAMVALAVRAAWRVLPATSDLSPDSLRAAAAALSASTLYSLGGVDEHLASAANAAMDDPKIHAMAAVFAASNAAKSVAEVNRAASYAADATKAAGEMVAAELADVCQAAAGTDLEWLRAWATEQRAADGIVGPDFYRRPLWLRPDEESPPEDWRRTLESWNRAVHAAGLRGLVEQHERLLKGGGMDTEQLHGFLDDRVREQQRSGGAISEDGNEPSSAARTRPAKKPRKSVDEPSAMEQDAEPEEAAETSKTIPEDDTVATDDTTTAEDAQNLPGGIPVTAADMPALEDHLGRKPLVQTLADMLASPEQALPMTIALLGDWGAGKTSVIEQLKVRLTELTAQDRDQFGASGRHRRNHYLFATFNAWEYEQTDNLRAGLAQEVVNGLTADLGRWDKLVLAVTKAAKGNVWEFWSTVAGLALALLGISLGYQLATPDQATEVLKTADLLGGGGLAAFGAYLLVNAWRTGRRLLEHPLATQMATYLKLPSYGEHLGEVPVIKKEIRELCEERLNSIPNGRLLVVVDDLDRCHPGAVTETLDAIRLVMNLPRVAVIIAVDDRIAFRAVADHYKDLEEGRRTRWEIARDYLGKIIQLPVNLYDPWPSEVAEFVRHHLFQVSDAAEAQADMEATTAPEPSAVTPVPAAPRLTAAAARLVGAQGLDAAAIPASGKDGQITEPDVRRFLKHQQARPEPAQAQPVDNPALMESQTQLAEEDLQATPLRSDAERAEERSAVMEDSVRERELFAELTAAMGFNNPRQLIRLRNSYRLLKGYRHSRGSAMRWPLLSSLMHGLFWYEHLYQMRLDQRQHAELVAWLWGDNPEWEAKAAKLGRNPPAVAMARRLRALLPADQWGAEYGRLMRTVDLVVLPNAQVGLILDRPRANAVWTERAEGRPLVPDPWGSGYVSP